MEPDAGPFDMTAFLKPGVTGLNDLFGWNVAVSSDGSTLAIGAYGEASASMVINAGQLDNPFSTSRLRTPRLEISSATASRCRGQDRRW